MNERSVSQDPIVYQVANSRLEVVAIHRAGGRLWSEVEQSTLGTETPRTRQAAPTTAPSPSSTVRP